MKRASLLIGAGLLWTQVAQAGAIHDANLFTTPFAANDDGSTASSLGFTINFYGSIYTDVYINNNGNVSFGTWVSEYTPYSLLTTTIPMLAPFFADVDTRGAGSSLVTYGQAVIDGRNVFGVNWIDVGYYNAKDDKLNSFQLIIIDRSDINPGDFDFEFNYDRILWETGDASGGVNGLGGSSARAGWSDGVSNAFELPGSAVNGALLDSNTSTGLIYGSRLSSVAGQYIFEVRNGQIQAVSEPGALALFAAGLFGLAGLRRRD